MGFDVEPPAGAASAPSAVTDTTAAVEEYWNSLYRSRSPGERVRMASGMFTTAKRLALAGIRQRAATQSAVAVRMALLERLHGEELTAEVRRLIASKGAPTHTG